MTPAPLTIRWILREPCGPPPKLEPQLAATFAPGEAFAPRSFFKNQGREFSGALLGPLAQSLFSARVPAAPAPQSF
jgi:hypothetical protein